MLFIMRKKIVHYGFFFVEFYGAPIVAVVVESPSLAVTRMPSQSRRFKSGPRYFGVLVHQPKSGSQSRQRQKNDVQEKNH